MESPPAFEGSPWSVVAPFPCVWFVFWSPVSVDVLIVVCESVVVWLGSSELNEKKRRLVRGAKKGFELREQYQCTCNVGGLVWIETRLMWSDLENLANDFVKVGTVDRRRQRAPGATREKGRPSLLTSSGDLDDVYHSEVQAFFSRQRLATLAQAGIAWNEVVAVNMVFFVQFDTFDVGHGLLLQFPNCQRLDSWEGPAVGKGQDGCPVFNWSFIERVGSTEFDVSSDGPKKR